MPDPATLRLFVAVELPATVSSVLTRLQHELQRDPALARLRWVRPEGIHLTLKFLGETEAVRQPRIEEAIQRGVDGMAPFGLHLGTIGSFGPRDRPRVVWVDVGGEVDILTQLQRAIDRELEDAGFRRETRPFSPHLTLARVPEDRGRDVAGPLASAIAAGTAPGHAEIAVREVSLMHSKLGPAGAVYTRLFAAPLR
jgi:2'-5' RNA ligase